MPLVRPVHTILHVLEVFAIPAFYMVGAQKGVCVFQEVFPLHQFEEALKNVSGFCLRALVVMFTISRRWTEVYLNNLFLCASDLVFCSVPFFMGILLVLISEAGITVSQGVNYVRGRLGSAEHCCMCCSFPVCWPMLPVPVSLQ